MVSGKVVEPVRCPNFGNQICCSTLNVLKNRSQRLGVVIREFLEERIQLLFESIQPFVSIEALAFLCLLDYNFAAVVRNSVVRSFGSPAPVIANDVGLQDLLSHSKNPTYDGRRKVGTQYHRLAT